MPAEFENGHGEGEFFARADMMRFGRLDPPRQPDALVTDHGFANARRGVLK